MYPIPIIFVGVKHSGDKLYNSPEYLYRNASPCPDDSKAISYDIYPINQGEAFAYKSDSLPDRQWRKCFAPTEIDVMELGVVYPTRSG